MDTTIELISWNICDTTGEPRRPPFSQRGPRLARFIQQHHPDASVLLFVEASTTSLDHLRPHLPGYEWVRMEAAQHESSLNMILAYRDLVLTHVERVWLTPERQVAWHRRFALRARFVHRETEKRFELWGVHLPAWGKARPISLDTLLKEVDEIPRTDPVVVLGDFNTVRTESRSGPELKAIARHGLVGVEPRKFLGRDWKPTGTFFGYSYDKVQYRPWDGSMLDRAFVRYGDLAVSQSRADLDTCTTDVRNRDAYVSDHHALIVQLDL